LFVNAEIRIATDSDLPNIASLAREIWRAHYPGIISHEQIEYMLNWMFDPDELRRQILNGTTYEILNIDGTLAGFVSYAPTSSSGEFKLDKLYVHKRYRGRGFGRRLLEHVIGVVGHVGGNSITLAVNKKNTDAIAMYERNGFRIRESVENDIGNGFVMDDYVMVRQL